MTKRSFIDTVKVSTNETNNLGNEIEKNKRVKPGDSSPPKNHELEDINQTSPNIDNTVEKKDFDIDISITPHDNIKTPTNIDTNNLNNLSEGDRSGDTIENIIEPQVDSENIEYKDEAKKILDESVNLLECRLKENNAELLIDILEDILSIRKENLYARDVFNDILNGAPGLRELHDIVLTLGTLTRLVIGREKVKVDEETVTLNEKCLIEYINTYLLSKLENLSHDIDEIGVTTSLENSSDI